MNFFMILVSMILITVTVVLIGLFTNRLELNMLNVLIAAAICILMGALVSIFLAQFGSAFFS